MSLLGIDVGTSGCKAAAFRGDGRLLGFAGREYAALSPAPGLAELDSRAVCAAVAECITEITGRLGPDPPGAICVSALGEAATPVSATGEILGGCILGGDARGGEYIARLEQKIDARSFFRINPNILSRAHTLPKLLWLKEHQPSLYARADKFLLWDGLVGHLLGCPPFTSYSSAARTLLFDINRCDWSPEIMAAAGLDADKLPPCRPSGLVAGTVAARAAASFGLPPGTPVVVGGHDQCCNALGAGVSAGGRAALGIGTYECVTSVFEGMPDIMAMFRARLNIEHHVAAGRYVCLVHNQAGLLVKWFRDTFARAERGDPGIYRKLDAEMPCGPTGLFVMPCFEPTGAPYHAGDVTGAIFGLRADTGRGEILKAIMEGITFYFAGAMETLAHAGAPAAEFIATGGGAKSDRWLQLKADILGRPVIRNDFPESTVAGAAILAGTAVGAFKDTLEGAAALARRARVFEPDRRRHALYRERKEEFQSLFTRQIGHPEKSPAGERAAGD